MNKRDLGKSRKDKKETLSAYEIYQRTKYLLWPVLLWQNESLPNSKQVCKKNRLLSSLSNKEEGLYFFTPGKTDKVEVYPLNGKLISKSKISLRQLKKAQKEFNKKYGNSDEWYIRINSRLRFLKKIISYYEFYEGKSAESLPLEELIFFATSEQQRPSQWLSKEQLYDFKNEQFITLKNVALTKRGFKTNWESEWESFTKKQTSFPLETITKIYQNKLFSPYTLKAICSFDTELFLSVLEELRLNGEHFPAELKHLSLLFAELQNFLSEPELRACLCRDFVEKFIYNGKITHRHLDQYFIQWSEANKFTKRFLKEHLNDQSIQTNRENFNIYDALQWFTGCQTKVLKKEIHFPKTFNSTSLLKTFKKHFHKKCTHLMPKLQKSDFFNLTFDYLTLLKANNSTSSLLNVISTCREFCPPGNEGNSALKLVEFIFQYFTEQKPDYVDWVSKNIQKILIHAHNKAMEGQLHSPEFERTKSILKQLLKFCPHIFESKLESTFLEDSEYLHVLLYIAPSTKCIKWIIDQDDAWRKDAITNRYNWDCITDMPDTFLLKVLDWATDLRSSGLHWNDISEILYSIYDIHTDENEAPITENLNFFQRVYEFSKTINALVQTKRSISNYDSHSDIYSFFEYFDYFKNGWENLDLYWKLFFEFIENYVNKTQTDDYSFYQDYYKTQWLTSLEAPPQRTVEILKIIPMYHNSFYEQTLQPLKWLSKNHTDVFAFLRESLKDKDSFNRLIHLLKMLKISLRLSQPKLSLQLEEWSSYKTDSLLKELKLHRRMAKFSNDLPRNVRKIIELPERLSNEKISLSTLEAKGRISQTALQRLNKVTEWLDNDERLQSNIESDLQKLLPEAVLNSKMDSLFEISENLCKEHWRTYSSTPIENWNDDWRNALQLSFLTYKNKRILRRLMLNASGNDFQWIFYHPKNIAFLKSLPNAFDKNLWAKPPKLKFKIGTDTYYVEAESNLLKILQMGNYFGSCLSVGDMNDFSTIANAVEINKHVLWIKDSKGKIIGRKLIVLSQNGELYGFNSYGAALGSNNENPWFKIIFDIYCQKLIKLCGGQLSNKRDENENLVLFSHWYDDGIESFDGWVMDIQRGKSVSYISKKVKFNEKSDVNLRAALWLKTQKGDIVVGWDNLKVFQRLNADSLSITQK